MDGWFFYSSTCSCREFFAALSEARGPEERRYFGWRAGGFLLSDNDFPDCVRVSHRNKTGSSGWCGGNPATIQHVYDNMFGKILIGWARSCVIIKSAYFLLKSSSIRGSDWFVKVSHLMRCSKSSSASSQQLKLSFQKNSFNTESI